MNDIQTIQSRIYEIRGQKVMLDRDLAELYHVTTGNLNKAVKRNIKRFPSDFMFQLTKEEFEDLKQSLIFQIGISNDKQKTESGILRTGRGGIRQLPYAFTEHGALMLSSVLRSDVAVETNIKITRAFVAMRQALNLLALPTKLSELEMRINLLRNEVDDILHNQNDINESTRAQFDAISTALAELQADKPIQKPRRRIGVVQDGE